MALCNHSRLLNSTSVSQPNTSRKTVLSYLVYTEINRYVIHLFAHAFFPLSKYRVFSKISTVILAISRIKINDTSFSRKLWPDKTEANTNHICYNAIKTHITLKSLKSIIFCYIF